LDDATQDVFVVVYRQMGGFEYRASPRTWIFSIAYNVASNYRRREQRKGGLLPLDAATPTTDVDPEGELGRARAWDFVLQFLDTLEEPKRAVFVLTQLEGMKAADVADALNTPVNTVYTRLHHARQAFREALAKFTLGDLP
jgi:RNA polymerase sigma-70 factor (ECF subfamily)